jgi:hypothetical protein
MCPLLGTNWVSISKKTAFFVATAVKTSNLKYQNVCPTSDSRGGLEFYGYTLTPFMLVDGCGIPDHSLNNTVSFLQNTYEERHYLYATAQAGVSMTSIIYVRV